jgi:hypothetical protein
MLNYGGQHSVSASNEYTEGHHQIIKPAEVEGSIIIMVGLKEFSIKGGRGDSAIPYIEL